MFNEHTKGRMHATKVNGGNEEGKYREILRELGIRKPENEPLNEQDLRIVFIRLQEDLFVGS